jgi:hypothetical protein
LYREFLARKAGKLGDLPILRMNRKDVLEPYWHDETDWLCTVEFLLLMTQKLGFSPGTSSATFWPAWHAGNSASKLQTFETVTPDLL